MLNVTESVNGKFNIVLTDGYKSQLHDRGKVKTKSGSVNENAAGSKSSKPKLKQQITKGKSKRREERSNDGKVTKPSRLAAKFNGKTTQAQEISGDGSETADKTTAYVTKDDLAKLLESLTGKKIESDASVTRMGEVQQQSMPDEKKIPQSRNTNDDHIKSEEALTNENIQASGKPFNEQENIEAVALSQSDPEQNVASTVVTETLKPTAMRSSFAIGAPGLVTNNPHDDKADKHRQWVRGLEQQIQEKKEREMQFKRNQSVGVSLQMERKSEGVSLNKPTNQNNPVGSAISTISQQETDRSSTGHARGRALMNMLSDNETDKQRKKIFEHQKAIELQVEDRRRQKMEERERRLREEAIEDERVAKEREKLQKQFEEEMIKMKEKEEQAKRRAHVLQEGISKAFESAQQLKRDKRKNRMLESTTKGAGNVQESHEDDRINGTTIREQVILPDNALRRHPVVPPLNLRTSISPVDKPDKSNERSLSDFTMNVKRHSLCLPDTHEKTSYAEEETDKDKSGTLMNKWVDEDFGSCTTNREMNYDGDFRARSSSEFIVPFHRTASATLFRESLILREAPERGSINKIAETNSNLTDRKIVKKGRSVPEVHPTRTSRLREKRTDNKNASLTSRRKKREAERPQQIIQKPKSQIKSQNTSDDLVTNKYKNAASISEDDQMTNIPSHLLATFTPTAHQEKILEQLAALRKGLLMKDQEIKTKVFQIEYEIQA
ncbi:calponin homology domain-containing protein DDB_G0272472-like [Dendronephthya gigantea]|uniref:calponin homology domain-containing protein DDB_G0272472-like n=1 Tax=Dendronephthya gigantea TaxID=151771 RepID=UPI00106A8BD1|nr:calponin homology domain-containing protein DDB_G0272472-like [Dendronephthya gigantea]